MQESSILCLFFAGRNYGLNTDEKYKVSCGILLHGFCPSE